MTELERARELGRAALQTLEANRRRIDDLNVYPVPDGDAGGGGDDHGAHELAVPLRLRGPGGRILSFISTVATFGTAVEVTASELSIESFFPADALTREVIDTLP